MPSRESALVVGHFEKRSSLERTLRALELEHGPTERGLVYDASESQPATWNALEDEFAVVTRFCQEAREAGVPVVFVLHESSLYGHVPALRSTLACGLLGGARSLAVEWRRSGQRANVVTRTGEADVQRAAQAVRWLLSADGITGQVITCGAEHVGRPAV